MKAVSKRGDRRFLMAQLVENGNDLLPSLLKAQVARITRNGVMLKGVEMTLRGPGSIKANVSKRPQTWCALVHASDLLAMFDDLDPLDEIAAMKRAI